MKTFLHRKFTSNIQKYIQKKRNLLLTISGGQDSLCLLNLAYDCLDKNHYRIQAIYIDHQWKDESLNHTKHIINIMQSREIPLSIYQIKSLALSENSARQTRYKTFIKHAFKEKCQIILTGHNNNDQIETFWHNIIRGTSLNGITNLTIFKQLNKNISIFRPLINLSKDEIAWFCRLFHLPIWSDITNYNFSIKRNRLRYELIPYLKNYFNPKIQSSITRFITLCQNENEYIKENVLKLYLSTSNKKIVCLHLNRMKVQHIILQKRVIKLFFYYHCNKQINEKLIKQLLTIDESTKVTTLFYQGLVLYYYHGNIYINNY